MYPYDYLNQKDYLCHHGILGQKWGVRRFQNGDGSLTVEGRKRYSKDDVKTKREKLDKDFPTLKQLKNVSDDNIGETYWLNYAKKSLEVSPAEIKKLYPKSPDDLWKEIEQKSGDWYNSKGVTKEFQDNRNKHKEVMKHYHEYRDKCYTFKKDHSLMKTKDYDKYSKLANEKLKEAHKLDDNLLGIVLNDIGYEDTKRNRNLIREIVIWD